MPPYEDVPKKYKNKKNNQKSAAFNSGSSLEKQSKQGY
jgi:hypothetical protein